MPETGQPRQAVSTSLRRPPSASLALHGIIALSQVCPRASVGHRHASIRCNLAVTAPIRSIDTAAQ